MGIEDQNENCLLNAICCILFDKDVKKRFKITKDYNAAIKKGSTYKKYYSKIKVKTLDIAYTYWRHLNLP